MSSFGVINHMVITMRNNLNLLQKNTVFKKGTDYFVSQSTGYKVNDRGIASEPISKEELLTIRRKIKAQNRRQRKRWAIYLLVTFPICVLLIYYTFKDYPLGVANKATTQVDRIMMEQEKRNKFLFFLNDGDEWLEKENYHNAVFQYRKALLVYPSEYSAQFRLAVGLSYQCQYDFKGCEQGLRLVKKLEKQYPDVIELQEMKAVFEHWGAQ